MHKLRLAPRLDHKMEPNRDLTTWPDCANEPEREKGGGRREVRLYSPR